MATRAQSRDVTEISIDMAIAALEAAEFDAVLRVVGAWEHARFMSPREASEWRRRISAQKRFRRFLEVRTLTIGSAAG